MSRDRHISLSSRIECQPCRSELNSSARRITARRIRNPNDGNDSIDENSVREHSVGMKAVEFDAQLKGGDTLAIPAQIASQLPKSGSAKVIVLFPDDPEDTAWRLASYAQFMREDSPEDSVYDEYGRSR